MNELSSINMKLKCSSILNVPLQSYNDEFTFIVNGEEFKTSKLVADLLSPTICQIHTTDPTFDEMIINTRAKGDFSTFLKLTNFENNEIQENEETFIIEIIEILGQTTIEINENKEKQEINKNNVFSLIQKHERFREFYSTKYFEEIEFISRNLNEILENEREEMQKLNEITLYEITKHSQIKLKDEDQLLKFVNSIYTKDDKYRILYENIIFEHVSSSTMVEFLQIFDYNDMNSNIWQSISKRLSFKIDYENFVEEEKLQERYLNSLIKFEHREGKEFEGIFNYLTNKNGGNPHDKNLIEITSNHIEDSHYHPKNLLDFNNDNYFSSGCQVNSIWVCFDFKSMRVCLSKYSIKSSVIHNENQGHIKNWVLEVSSDGKNWTKIDGRTNYSELNSNGSIKTFEVNNNNFSRYVRIRHTGNYWKEANQWYLKFNSIEFYGELKNNII